MYSTVSKEALSSELWSTVLMLKVNFFDFMSNFLQHILYLPALLAYIMIVLSLRFISLWTLSLKCIICRVYWQNIYIKFNLIFVKSTYHIVYLDVLPFFNIHVETIGRHESHNNCNTRRLREVD